VARLINLPGVTPFVDVVGIAQGLISQYGILGLFISVMLMNASILLPLPADLVIFSAGALSNGSLLFNPLVIGLVAGLAASIGELTAWAVGYETDKLVLKKRHGATYQKVESMFKDFGFVGIAVFSLLPFPHDVIGLFAGAVRYDVVKYFTATLIGKTVRCVLLAYAGYYGATAALQIFPWAL
jgi:membrane protein DedA with SNARE-associated domain